jgi:transposase, IS5 family
MATDDFFRPRLDSMIDMRHPRAVLATRMPWERGRTSEEDYLARRAVSHATSPHALTGLCGLP